MSVTSDLTLEGDVAFFESKGLLADEPDSDVFPPPRRSVLSSKRTWALVASVVINVAFATQVFLLPQGGQPADVVSTYAHLSRDKPTPFMTADQNESLPDSVWDSWDVDRGTVALPDSYVKAMGLPLAQRWPWDFTKGIYYIQAYHQMHCIKMLRISLEEFRAGKLQSEHPTHIDHCLTGIVEQIVCNADDTPRYTGGHFKHPSSGTGQIRMCRDWNKLEQWAIEHSACYKEPEDTFDKDHILERYMHCPDKTRPWEDAEIWGMDDSLEKGGLWLDKDPKFDN